MCQANAFLCANRMHLAKKGQKFQILGEKHMCQADALYVPTECTICANWMRLGKTQENTIEKFTYYVPSECAFMCQPDAPKNGERTIPRHKKEFSTCSVYLKIKYIKKGNR